MKKKSNRLARRVADRLRVQDVTPCYYVVEDENGNRRYQNGVQPAEDKDIKLFVGFDPAQWDETEGGDGR